MSTKITKEELRKPDFFLSHAKNVVDFMLKYKQALVATGLSILVVAIGWLSYNFIQKSRETSAIMAFYPVEKKIREASDASKPIPDPAIDAYDKVLKDHAGTRAAMVSAVVVTPSLIKAGKASKLYEWYKTLSFLPSKSDVDFGLSKMATGLVAMENAKADEAIASFDDVLKNDAQKDFHPEAMLKSGLAFEMKNDLAKAREQFEKLRRDHPNTQAGQLALQYLIYLDMKKGA